MRVIEPRADARIELRNALAAVRACMLEIGGPGVDLRTLDGIPALHLPRAEIHLREPRIDARREAMPHCKRIRNVHASREWTRFDVPRHSPAKRGEPLRDARGFLRRIARERHIAPAVADTCLDRHSRMPDQNEIHASPTR